MTRISIAEEGRNLKVMTECWLISLFQYMYNYKQMLWSFWFLWLNELLSGAKLPFSCKYSLKMSLPDKTQREMIVKNSLTKTLICSVRILTFCRNCTGMLQFIFNAMEEYSKPFVFSCLKCAFAFGFRNSRGFFAQLYIVLERQNATLFFCLPHKIEIYTHVFWLLLVISSNLCILYFMCT